MRYINTEKILAAQLITPAENPLVGDDTRLIEIWFDGSSVRKQLFKKVHKTEQEAMAQKLEKKGFIRSGNLLLIREPSSLPKWSTKSSAASSRSATRTTAMPSS